MGRSLTTYTRLGLLIWSVFNTGVLILGFQLFAWFHMAHNLPEEYSFVEAVQLVTNGLEGCEICDFTNENNPMHEQEGRKIVLFEVNPLYFVSTPTSLLDSLSLHYLWVESEHRMISLVGLGLDPPPPRLSA